MSASSLFNMPLVSVLGEKVHRCCDDSQFSFGKIDVGKYVFYELRCDSCGEYARGESLSDCCSRFNFVLYTKAMTELWSDVPFLVD